MISRPTIRRASSRLSTSRAAASPATSPRRSTTTRSQMERISSSLWLMKITECPSPVMRRSTANSSSASLGVSTEVGSSRISRSAPASRALRISTRCCSPADSCQMRARGFTARP